MVGALNQTKLCYKTKPTKPKSKPTKPKSNISTNQKFPNKYGYTNTQIGPWKWEEGGVVEVESWRWSRGGETVTPWDHKSERSWRWDRNSVKSWEWEKVEPWRWSRGGGAVEVRPWECLTVRSWEWSWECLNVRHRSATMRPWTPEIETDESES